MGQKVTVAESRQTVAAICTTPFSPPPLAWASTIFEGGTTAITEHRRIHRCQDFLLISLSYPALDLDGGEFEALVAGAYRTLRTELQSEPAHHPLRIWNFVPGILAPAGDSVDRYMRFNAGRYREFIEWFGAESAFDYKVPTASAVGHDGTDFVLHALCGREPARPITNPRQRAAHRYSRKFGPIPPCFARAVLIDSESAEQLLIGGTASVVDEETLHVGQLDLQLIETRKNLAALITNAFGAAIDPAECVDHLRAYHVTRSDRQMIEGFLTTTYPNLRSLEFHVGDLCRGDLLVEIEGHARRRR